MAQEGKVVSGDGPPRWPAPDGHRSAERRSLAMHQLISSRLDEAMRAAAAERVRTWLDDGGPVDPHWAEQWAVLLDAPLTDVRRAIATDDPATTQLRQTTPFAGVLSNADRWRLLREVQ